MTKGSLRAASVEDAGALARLQILTWRAAYRGILPQPLLDGLSLQETTRQWRGYLTEGVATLLLEGSAGPVGFAGYGPAREFFAGEPMGELYALYLHPHAWGQGAGRSLLAGCREALRASGYFAFVVWVLRENTRARAFYHRQDLVLDGAEKTEHMQGHPLRQVRYYALTRPEDDGVRVARAEAYLCESARR